MLEGRFKKVSRVFQESFKGVSRKFQVIKGIYKNAKEYIGKLGQWVKKFWSLEFFYQNPSVLT